MVPNIGSQHLFPKLHLHILYLEITHDKYTKSEPCHTLFIDSTTLPPTHTHARTHRAKQTNNLLIYYSCLFLTGAGSVSS